MAQSWTPYISDCNTHAYHCNIHVATHMCDCNTNACLCNIHVATRMCDCNTQSGVSFVTARDRETTILVLAAKNANTANTHGATHANDCSTHI